MALGTAYEVIMGAERATPYHPEHIRFGRQLFPAILGLVRILECWCAPIRAPQTARPIPNVAVQFFHAIGTGPSWKTANGASSLNLGLFVMHAIRICLIAPGITSRPPG